MTRLEKKLLGEARYPEDVAILKKLIPELRDVTDATVESLYSEWSESCWSAGWLNLDAEGVSSFAYWLREVES